SLLHSSAVVFLFLFFFFQAEDGIRDFHVTGVQTCALPIYAEGLLHDTFALIWRNADQYDSRFGSARAWTYSVLRHLAQARRSRMNEAPPATAPALPPASAVRGDIARLAQQPEPLAYDTVAHAYLHGADYRRLAAWLHRDEAELRMNTRNALRGLPA